jgi:hypothetical protein
MDDSHRMSFRIVRQQFIPHHFTLPTLPSRLVDTIRKSGRAEGQAISTLAFLIVSMHAANCNELHTFRIRALTALTTTQRPFCTIYQFHRHATEECSKLAEMQAPASVIQQGVKQQWHQQKQHQ